MKTAEEIFNTIPFLDRKGDYFNMPKEEVLNRMEQYAWQFQEPYGDVYNRAIEEFGVVAQVDMLIEEMAELTQALLKWRRGKDAMDNVHEEVADVEIMLAQIKTGLNPNIIKNHKDYKIERLKNLLALRSLNKTT